MTGRQGPALPVSASLEGMRATGYLWPNNIEAPRPTPLKRARHNAGSAGMLAISLAETRPARVPFPIPAAIFTMRPAIGRSVSTDDFIIGTDETAAGNV